MNTIADKRNMTPIEVANRYFECVRAKDIEGLVSLYADDAVITLPNGAQIAGINAIRAFQTDVAARSAPFPNAGPRVIGDKEIAVEIKVTLPDGSVRSTANFFFLNNVGRIHRLSVYTQGS